MYLVSSYVAKPTTGYVQKDVNQINNVADIPFAKVKQVYQ